MKFPKIITGRQTGVEQAALAWAVANGIPHEQGEMEDNVLRSGATVIFTRTERLRDRAEILLDLAAYHRKEWLHIHHKTELPAGILESIIGQSHVRHLHVSGSTASEESGLSEFVHQILDQTAAFLKER